MFKRKASIELELELADTLAKMALKAMDKTGEDIPPKTVFTNMAAVMTTQAGYAGDTEATARVARYAEMAVVFFMAGFDFGKERDK